EECAACAEEAAHWKLVGLVKRYDGPRLNALAHRRILDRLVTAASSPAPGIGPATLAHERAVPRPRSRRALIVAVPALAAAAAALVLLVGTRHRPRVVAEGETLDAIEAGTVTFGGARIAYRPGTRMTFHPAARALTLSRGEVDLDVTPGLPGRFHVNTSRFIVEVLGTRFAVTPDDVRTRHGTVRVLGLAGQPLAVVPAGEGWTFHEPVLPPVVAAPPETVATPASPRPPEAAAVRGERLSNSDLLARGRAALARGDAKQARALGTRVLAASPTDGQAAAAELLLAQALLVARHPDDAIRAFRRVARTRPAAPEGELATFTIGQLLFERGAGAEADAAFDEYLTRYPSGRFVREARERLVENHPGR
ncbi:MAG TPA: tetratricopeptide repeat protein, partial [Polyangia bacterium]|nr:tetratricopeptide repeat protein [Polyangia bacterium]